MTTKNALPITRQQNFADWYQEVIKGADLAENSGVRGCMIIKPWGYAIWERMQRLLDDQIKATGHDNCYFPIFIPLDLFEKEATHVEGFAKEMAVVTHSRLEVKDGKLQLSGKLETPLVVRPTSETVISEAFARWVKSYRDLPVLINQWANVVRWEMRTRIFLRTSEFLWQEGHTAHATQAEAEEETMKMLEVYRQFMEGAMCMPVIVGRKSPDERFAGALETYTLEAMMQDGKALQSGTSHYLGHTFAKAANIMFQDQNGQMQYVHTTSWGVSTRMMGGLIMCHSDDDGLQLPPQLAPRQVVILPILKDESKTELTLAYAQQIKNKLAALSHAGEKIRVSVEVPKGDDRGRYWDWVRKGVPIILEVGPRDVEAGTVAMATRDQAQAKKAIVAVEEVVNSIDQRLTRYAEHLYKTAADRLRTRTVSHLKNLADIKQHFAQDQAGFARIKWCGDVASVEPLNAEGITIRCLPLEQSGTSGVCALTGKPATLDAIIAKSY